MAEKLVRAFGDVVAAICDKMVRRHPRVRCIGPPARSGSGAAAVAVADAEQQTRAWSAGSAPNARPGDADTSALAGIRGLPEWQRAVKLQHKAAKVGLTGRGRIR